MGICVMKPEWSCSVWDKPRRNYCEHQMEHSYTSGGPTTSQANCSSPILTVVTDMGWKRTDSHLVPYLLSLSPITRACSEIMSRGFTKGCLSCKIEKSIELNYFMGTCYLNLNTLMEIVHDNFGQGKSWTKLSCPIWINVFKFRQQVPSI